MFTSSIKHPIGNFTSQPAKKCTKKCNARGEWLFWLFYVRLLLFWRSRCRRHRRCWSSLFANEIIVFDDHREGRGFGSFRWLSDDFFFSVCGINCFYYYTIKVYINIFLFSKQPANIFVSRDFKLTLIDYGNARKIQAAGGQLVDAVGVTEFTGGYSKQTKKRTKIQTNKL